MRVIIDAMGGDNAPEEIVKGAVRASRELDVEVVLVGQMEKVQKCLADEGATDITVIDARDVITMEDDPSTATRRKKDASMTVALNMLRDGEGDAVAAPQVAAPKQEPASSNSAEKEISSPLEGKFFLTKEASEKPLKVGDTVKVNDTIGYIESMKTYNAIASEVEGVVTEICYANGSTVEEEDILVKVK